MPFDLSEKNSSRDRKGADDSRVSRNVAHPLASARGYCFNFSNGIGNLMKIALLLAITCLAIPGCGGGSDDEPVVETEAPITNPVEQVTVESQPTAETSASPQDQLEWPTVSKSIFFNDPLAIAANSTIRPGKNPRGTTVVMTSPGTSPATSPASAPTNSTPSSASTGSATDWSELITIEVLNEEVQNIRNRLSGKVRTVAEFNNGYLDIPYFAAELAALAGVVSMHPGDLSWKPQAKYVRELAAEINSEDLRRGAKSQRFVRGIFDRIDAALNNNLPPDLPDASDEVDFSEVADFGSLMKRIEVGGENLGVIAGSEVLLKQNSDAIRREALVQGVLAQVIAAEGYGYGDDATFRGYANDMSKAAAGMAAAAKSANLEQFDLAKSLLGQSCTNCHGEYR
ncbi:cytochrome c [Calycomorphotria hydatis]|uniref:Cytochrome C n=1 Tax=Calycomorphotria hydatis TaxID=2528027 RepID=A0A517TAU7_9PLAN|nr:cytochrome c [Calycomorphotria hydatis]QDT65499.1 Cytochrome C' [Calycomorphotria hydatis]